MSETDGGRLSTHPYLLENFKDVLMDCQFPDYITTKVLLEFMKNMEQCSRFLRILFEDQESA